MEANDIGMIEAAEKADFPLDGSFNSHLDCFRCIDDLRIRVNGEMNLGLRPVANRADEDILVDLLQLASVVREFVVRDDIRPHDEFQHFINCETLE
jgi:hypothetical protein